MSKSFSPLLAPNQQIDLNELQYPLLASYKLDGIRCLLYKGKILSRSLKEIQNKQLKDKLEPLRQFTEDNQIILDGEIYSPELTFQEIVSFVMTQDFEDKKSIKKFGKVLEIPKHLKFYGFDCVQNDDFDERFVSRQEAVHMYSASFGKIAEALTHTILNSAKDVEEYFQRALADNCEGLILRNSDGKYKFGRATLKENIIYKVKPFETFDSKITGFVQSTEVNEDVEKKINELGHSVTSKKKDDRHTIEKCSAVYVDYEVQELKVTLAMTDEEKEEIWHNQKEYLGRWIEYKAMRVGMKEGGLPRHPVFIRFREDKE